MAIRRAKGWVEVERGGSEVVKGWSLAQWRSSEGRLLCRDESSHLHRSPAAHLHSEAMRASGR